MAWTAREKNVPLPFQRMACVAKRSCRDRRAFASIPRTCARGPDLSRGQYSGQVGPVYIEPGHDPGAYDREVFLTPNVRWRHEKIV